MLYFLLFLLLALTPASEAHWTGLDKYGCHKSAATGDYQCHVGPLAGKTYTNQKSMLLDLNAPPPTPTPELAAWEKAMVENGRLLCSGSQADTYYDSARVYYQIADYTKDATWNDCAKSGVLTYRDGYLKPNNNGAASWNIFPHGLWQDWLRTHDQASHDAAMALAINSAFASSYPLEWTMSADYSREVAYNVMAKTLATSQGVSVWGYAQQVEQTFDHVRQWMDRLNGKPVVQLATEPGGVAIYETAYVRPFMAALTTEAMIQWAGDDPAKVVRALTTLQPLWDALWTQCWLAEQRTMAYTNIVAPDGSGGRDPAPDLNLLIAPAYAWLYKQTGQVGYRDKADALFSGGVAQAWLAHGKQFNQNYRWSFKYIEWRNGTAPTPVHASQ